MSQSLDTNKAEDDRLLLSLRDRQLRTLFETTLDAIVIFDDQGYYLDVNSAACELFGLERDELLGRCISEFATPGFDFSIGWQEFIEQEKSRGEFRLVRTDGELRILEYVATANFLPQCHLAVMRDITELKRAEAKIQKLSAELEAQILQPSILQPSREQTPDMGDRPIAELELELEQFFNLSLDLLCIIDNDGYFRRLNRSWETILGYDIKELEGRLSLDFVHPEDFDSTIETMFELSEQKPILEFTNRYRAKDGIYLYLEWRSMPYGNLIYAAARDVTDRKQAELEMQQTQSFLTSIIENIPNMVFVKDADNLQFVRFNKAGEELIGYPREALIGKSDRDFFPPEEANFFIAKDREVLANGDILDIPEEQIQTNHQGTRILHTKKIPILNRFGRPEYLLGISEDITEQQAALRDRKAAETALAESEAQNRAILQAIPDIMFRINKEGVYLSYNGSSELLGFQNGQQSIGKNMADYLPPEVYQRQKHYITLALETRKIQAYEHEVIIKGKAQQEEVRIVPIEDKDEVLFIIRDISAEQAALRDRKLAETALAESEAQNRAILQAIPDIMMRFNRAGVCLSYSNPMQSSGMLSGRDPTGRNIVDYLPPEIHQLRSHYMTIALETRQTQIYEQEVIIAGRVQQEEVRIIPIEGMEEVLVMIRDINEQQAALRERKQAENLLKERTAELEATLQRLQNTQVQLIQSEKMSSLGQLVAGIAHEINNPVSFIYGNTQHATNYVNDLIELVHLYQENYPEPPLVISEYMEEINLEYLVSDFSKLLESIENGAIRIRDIIKSLRMFSRLDESACKTIDIHENIDSTLMILQGRFNGRDGKPEIQLVKNYGDLPRIQCYSGLLNQVFVNLLMNATDAIEQYRDGLDTPQLSEYRGMITITTSLTATNQTIISIHDNGCGMNAQIQEKIFNPFFTTKPIGQGTGMGLAISYQIITENHHGEISLSSELGKGTEITLTLPRLSLDCSIPLV